MMNTDCRRRFCFLIPFAVLAFAGLLALAVHCLWNGVLVDVIGVKTITYWQALGLLVLSKILFGGFPCRGRGCGPRGRDRMLARYFESLDPEQREKMREEMRSRFGDWPRPRWCGSKHDKPADSEKSS